MTPRDLDPDALAAAWDELRRRNIWWPDSPKNNLGYAIRAYLNALGLVMVPELKTGVPGKGEA